MKPLKHAEVIKQWADGAKIEYRNNPCMDWKYTDLPAWVEDYEYRVKPAREYPKVQMSHQELTDALGPGSLLGPRARDILDIGLRHAIDHGQVVTREEFDRAIGDRKARDMAVAEAVRKFACEVPETSFDRYDAAYKIGRIDLQAIIAKVQA